MSNLPSNYTELMYIQSTGKQYIDTEFVPNGNTRVQTTFSSQDTSTQAIFCGGRTTANGTDAHSFSAFYINQNIRRDYFGTSKTTTSKFAVGTKITIDANKNKTVLSAGNGEITDFTASTTSGIMPLLLFSSSYQKASDSSYQVPVNNLANIKLYSCKIWDNGTLVRDFVPCNHLGVIGLYDKVNNKFYTNVQSNSAFVPGPPSIILPSGYSQVEYIESDGSSWCGTGLTINQSDNFIYYLNAELVNNDYYSGANGYLQFQANVASGNRANICITYKNIIETIKVDSAIYSSKDWTAYTGTNVKIGIFKMGDTDDSWFNGAAQVGKIYHLQIMKDDILVRNFIPCSSSSGYGFYDTIGKQFYPSVGNGNFTGGNFIDTSTKKGHILNYSYTAEVQSVTLPAGEYKLECWGAQGGSYSASFQGGLGGYSVGILTLTEETTLNIYVGGQPAAVTTNRTVCPGGFNGGGDGYNRYYSSVYSYGQGGGGGTDIRINDTTLYSRVIVAGGGGGSSSNDDRATKYGGGKIGGCTIDGGGGQQTSGGSASKITAGIFGTGASTTTNGGNYKYGSGGGGGGWYGGGACSTYNDSTNYRSYNGGGSGYVYTAGTVSSYPSGCLLNSTYYLTDAQTIAGNTSFPAPSGSTETGHSGNGFARITILSLKSNYTIYPKVDGVWKTGVGVWIRENDVWKSASVLSIKYGDIWHSSGQGGAVTPEPSGQTLGNLAVGSVVKINVNNTPRDFLIVHQGLPSRFYDDSCNGTWLLMKDIYEKHVWYSENVNKYENSAIHSYLNNTFLNLFNSNAKNIIKQVKIPYRSGGGSGGTDKIGANGLSTKIFLLSGYEVGFTTSDNQYFPVEGAKLSYFESGDGTSANNKRIAKLNGSADYWWLRSPYTHDVNNVWRIFSDGDYNYGGASYSYGLRPALILPSTTIVSEDNLIS